MIVNDFGMPTLIENRTLQENIDLCTSLGLKFIELNMNFPEYQIDKLEDYKISEINLSERLMTAEKTGSRCVLETKTIEALKQSVNWLRQNY